MKAAARRSILFTLERLLVRGAHYRFLFVAAMVGLVSVVGGLLLVSGDPSSADTGGGYLVGILAALRSWISRG